jgi:2-polyprenyl-6-methoxyphenol hydroxylase-like FAD-dependent oxidoreductase
VILAGDAAALCRPHSASGAVKAMQEAVAFEAAGSSHKAWPEVLAALEAECRPAGTEAVEISRLLGNGLVEHKSDWAAMTSEQAELFITSLIAGHKLYMQSSLPRPASTIA